METKEILGLDVGRRRTGIARASNVAKIAEPMMGVATDRIFGELNKYFKKRDIEAIVVGLPRNLSGNDTEQTAWVRAWVDQAKQKLEVPFYWQDEALTSQEALKVQKTKLKGRNFDEHALSAAIVLQDFLDLPETDRAVC